MADLMQQARELLATEYEKVGAYGAAQSLRHNDPIWINSATLKAISNALQKAEDAALRAAPEWQPIETAPEGKLIVVAWLDDEGGERQEFDYIEDGMWIHHADLVEHAQMVAPPGSKMPKEQPPYQWWMDLPVLPAARPQGVEDA